MELSRTRCAKLDGDIPNFASMIATRGIMESSGTCSDSRSHVMPPSVVSARSAPASTRQTIPAGRCIVRLVACRAQVRLRFGSCAKPTRRHIHVFGRSWRVVDARSCVGYAHFRLHTEPFAEPPTRSTSASAAPHPRERVATPADASLECLVPPRANFGQARVFIHALAVIGNRPKAPARTLAPPPPIVPEPSLGSRRHIVRS